jgi:hypothetical protein
MKTNFETKEQALKYTVKKVKEHQGSYYWRAEVITKFMNMIERVSNFSEFYKKLEVLTKDNKESSLLYSTTYYRDSFLESLNNQTKDGLKRLFFTVGSETSEKLHLFDLLDFTVEDMEKVIDILKTVRYQFLNELLYEYFVHHQRKDLAKKVLLLEIKDSSRDFVMSSNNVNDYESLFEVIKGNKKIKSKIVLLNLENYLRCFYRQDNPINHELNNKLFKEYKVQLKKLNFSRFIPSNTYNEDKEDNLISPFDLLDSNAGYRANLIGMKEWNTRRLIRDLKEKDEERLSNIIIKHLNTEHRNGLRKTQFLRTYRKIKDEVNIDVFKLDPKLQSYVLLEQIG